MSTVIQPRAEAPILNADRRLADDVIGGGFCIGCGVCSVGSAAAFEIGVDDLGRKQARWRGAAAAANGRAGQVTAICPFGHDAPNEDVLGEALYGATGHGLERTPELGFYRALYAGSVSEGSYRAQGSSGGLGSWLLAELLRLDLVDRVIHVAPGAGGHAKADLFRYRIVDTVEGVRGGAHSRYYPVDMAAVLEQVRATPGRYAVVGIPCFVKAVRLLARADPLIAERITFAVAIFCGHLKSRHFASYFAWQMGIHPDQLESFAFRVKQSERPANQYAVRATGLVDGERVTRERPTRELDGANWAHGYFKYQACDWCDDIAGETADVAVGDAWLPNYVGDWRGTNVAIVRHPVIHEFIEAARRDGRLELDELGVAQVLQSQAGSFRHRRAGLAVRLAWRRWFGGWTPPKRVRSDSYRVPFAWRLLFLLRMALLRRSHLAFQAALESGDVTRVTRVLRPWRSLYARVERFARRRALSPELMRR